MKKVVVGIHAANLKTSKKLQKIHEILSDGKAHTTAELQDLGASCCVATRICELRKNGLNIECNYLRKDMITGSKIYEYRLV